MTKTIILACSGPSLRRINLNEAHCEICAISTAIQYVPNPHFWLFIDTLNREYGPDRGKGALDDPLVRKVVPEHRQGDLRQFPRMSVTYAPYNSSDQDEGRSFLDGKRNYLRLTQKSILFAVQWFCRNGYTQLVFAGCDLHTDIVDPYCWRHKRSLSINRVNIHNEKHAQINTFLQDWQPIARDKGIEFLSWTDLSPINEYMKPYDPKQSTAFVLPSQRTAQETTP